MGVLVKKTLETRLREKDPRYRFLIDNETWSVKSCTRVAYDCAPFSQFGGSWDYDGHCGGCGSCIGIMLRDSHTSLILDSEPDCEMAMKLSEEMVISRLLEIEVGAPLNAKRLSDFFDEAEETVLSALTAMEARGIVRSEEAIACRWCDTLNYEPFEHSVEDDDDMPSMAQEPCCTACSRRLVRTNARKIFRRTP